MLRHSNNKRNRKTSQHTFTLTSNHFDQLTWPKFPFILQILYSSFYDIIIVKNIINKMLMKLLWIFSALMKKKNSACPNLFPLKCIIKRYYFFFAACILILFLLNLSFCPWKGSLNCASFVAGIVEAVLHGCNFVSSRVSSIYIRFQLFESWIPLHFVCKFLLEACYKKLNQYYLSFIYVIHKQYLKQ